MATYNTLEAILAGSRLWYNGDFMLKVRRSLPLKRPNLPDLDIVRSYPQDLPPITTDKNISSILRTFQQKPAFNVPVSLHKAGSAWKPSNKQDSKDDTTELLLKMQSQLNKLSPDNFDKIMTQVQDMIIDTFDKLDGCADMLFEKVISEPNFSPTYAKMAQRLGGLSAVNSTGNQVTFRTLLLQRCQKEFEREKNDNTISDLVEKIDNCNIDEEKKRLTEEKNVAEFKSKKRSLGNVKFIGELFKLKLLNENIMFQCLEKLLAEDEESLECLCKLLSTIGKTLEIKSVAKVDSLMTELQAFKTKKTTIPRVKFMIMDVVDLRKAGWASQKDEGPKTISQVHIDAQKEKIEKASTVQQVQTRPVTTATMDSRPSASNYSRSNASYNPSAPKNPYQNERINFSQKLQNNDTSNARLGFNSNNWRSGARNDGKAKEVVPTQNRFSHMDALYKPKVEAKETGSKFTSLGRLNRSNPKN